MQIMQIYQQQQQKTSRRFLCPCQCMQTSSEWILFLNRFSGLEYEEVSDDDFFSFSISLRVLGYRDGNKKSYCCYFFHATCVPSQKWTIHIFTIGSSDGMKRDIIRSRNGWISQLGCKIIRYVFREPIK